MYIAGQTLRHKRKKELVRLWPLEGTQLDWGYGKREYMDAQGQVFVGDPNDYTHVENEFGQPLMGYVREGEYVDTSLMDYLVSRSTQYTRRKARLRILEQEFLRKTRERDHIISPFYVDGSYCEPFYQYIKQKYHGVKLFQLVDPFLRDRGPEVFYIEGAYWYDSKLGFLKVKGDIHVPRT